MPQQEMFDKIVEFGNTLHKSGCPPYKVEKFTQHYAKQHNVQVMLQALPTSINYQFPEDNNKVIMKRLPPASIDLSLLAQTIQRLRRPNGATKKEPFRYPIWAVALANMSIPPAYLMLIGSTLEAIICSLFLGFMV